MLNDEELESLERARRNIEITRNGLYDRCNLARLLGEDVDMTRVGSIVDALSGVDCILFTIVRSNVQQKELQDVEKH